MSTVLDADTRDMLRLKVDALMQLAKEERWPQVGKGGNLRWGPPSMGTCRSFVWASYCAMREGFRGEVAIGTFPNFPEIRTRVDTPLHAGFSDYVTACIEWCAAKRINIPTRDDYEAAA